VPSRSDQDVCICLRIKIQKQDSHHESGYKYLFEQTKRKDFFFFFSGKIAPAFLVGLMMGTGFEIGLNRKHSS
jgi:hypothetical protein